ncbi:MAG: hypothetical protein ACI9F9_002251, partial [Candidatus Paceibacteria bacterium]
GPQLPYHVAFQRVHDPEVEFTHTPDSMRLEFDANDLSYLNNSLERVLGEQIFSKITTLDTPTQDGHQDAEWLTLRAARETNADLLLTVDLSYGTAIHNEVSFFRAPSTPLWIIPGIHYWWAPDQAYNADIHLTVKLFDLARCSRGEADRPLELRRWFFSHALPMNEVYMDFIDRAGDRQELYFESLLIPCTFLATDDEVVETALRKHFIDSLTESLSFELDRNKTLLIRNEHDHSFYLDPSDLEVERIGQHQARVRFSLEHKIGRSRNEPAAILLFPGDGSETPALKRLQQADLIKAQQVERRRPGYARYRFERTVKITPETEHLRLHVAAGGALASVREFTLALPGLDSAAENGSP